MTEFKNTHGWASQRGYKTFNFHLGGEELKSEVKALSTTGFEILDDPVPTKALVKGLRFNAFTVVHANGGPMTMTWNRTRASARRRSLFVFVNKGAVQLRGAATTAIAPAGGIGLIYPGSSQAVIDVKSDSETVFFSFDQNEIRPLEITAAQMVILRTNSPVFRAAYAYFTGMVGSPDDPDIGSSQVLRELTREMARALSLEASSSAPKMDTLGHARQIIERRYRSLSFTVRDVAAELGLSRRSLERACAEQEVSLTDELRARRTRHARHLLADQPHLALHEIASLSGFSSAEVMRRAFGRYYGDSPSEIRKSHANLL